MISPSVNRGPLKAAMSFLDQLSGVGSFSQCPPDDLPLVGNPCSQKVARPSPAGLQTTCRHRALQILHLFRKIIEHICYYTHTANTASGTLMTFEGRRRKAAISIMVWIVATHGITGWPFVFLFSFFFFKKSTQVKVGTKFFKLGLADDHGESRW